MTGPLTAGEPLAPPVRGGRGETGAPAPQPGDPRGRSPKPPKRGPGLLLRGLRGLMGAFLGLIILGGLVGAVGGYLLYDHYSHGLPDVDGLRNYQPPVMSRVYAGNGELLADLATQKRIFVPFDSIPPIVRQAFISAEDRNFYHHGGIDPVAIMRAAAWDLIHLGQHRPLGASTITQQVAKNMLLNNQLSLARKIKEAILAERIEQAMSKDRILELYLNEIYLGMGSYGVAAASQAYFNKPLDKLTIAEAAFLGGLPKAPNAFNPFKHPNAARIRRDYVLDRLREDNAITRQQEEKAKASPVVPTLANRPPPIPGANWFTEEVRRKLIKRFGQDTTTEGGLMVRTSLDPTLQAAAENALRDGLMAYDRARGGWRGPVTHLDLTPKDFEAQWPTKLNETARPPGMLDDWKLAVVSHVAAATAAVEWLGSKGARHAADLALVDLHWARPVHDGRLGPIPRRMDDIVHVGDVVMISPPKVRAEVPRAPPPPHRGRRPMPVPPPVNRATLRQIPKVEGALVSLNPQTGRVLAMVGGWSFQQSQFNRATQAQRQPGSSFKPMVYLTALEQGISPSQKFLDAPIVVNTPEGQWRPGNYEGTFSGPTPLRIALEQSLNLVTLRVAQHVGMQAIAKTAEAFHMVDSLPLVLPAALGAADTTVLREAGAYASLANGGRLVTPSLIDSVQDPAGHVVSRPEGLTCSGCSDPSKPPEVISTQPQIADADSVYQLIKMMEGVVRRGTGIPAGRGLNRPIAGKTGTTQDFNDAWFGGFTPNLVTVVWVGYDTPASLGNNETGGAVAGPIWHDYMAKALSRQPVLSFPKPQGVTLAQWDTGSGVVTDAFKDGQTPGASLPLGVELGSTGVRSSDGGRAAANGGGNGANGTSPGSAQPASPGNSGVDKSLGGLY